ncbi:hypothetical protein Nepgr_007879 [Nepenthes gracilis]|uniref:Uncharacterized protein n=1 Tax=Nepenthes gracilis TaxID=150966 RepID=A0AAD3S825_NEPGR|nr:hypothetical protein Nepgr_007879 [Nepenthes gracilis]
MRLFADLVDLADLVPFAMKLLPEMSLHADMRCVKKKKASQSGRLFFCLECRYAFHAWNGWLSWKFRYGLAKADPVFPPLWDFSGDSHNHTLIPLGCFGNVLASSQVFCPFLVLGAVDSTVCLGEPAVLASLSGDHQVGLVFELPYNQPFPLPADTSVCSSEIPHPGTLTTFSQPSWSVVVRKEGSSLVMPLRFFPQKIEVDASVDLPSKVKLNMGMLSSSATAHVAVEVDYQWKPNQAPPQMPLKFFSLAWYPAQMSKYKEDALDSAGQEVSLAGDREDLEPDLVIPQSLNRRDDEQQLEPSCSLVLCCYRPDLGFASGEAIEGHVAPPLGVVNQVGFQGIIIAAIQMLVDAKSMEVYFASLSQEGRQAMCGILAESNSRAPKSPTSSLQPSNMRVRGVHPCLEEDTTSLRGGFMKGGHLVDAAAQKKSILGDHVQGVADPGTNPSYSEQEASWRQVTSRKHKKCNLKKPWGAKG